jgi:hypothetical protein
MTAPDDRTAMPPAGQPHDETTALPPVQAGAPSRGAGDTAGPARAELDDDLFEPDWDKPRRTNKLTYVLIALLVAALGFAGGVMVQKNHDKALAVAAAGTRARAGQFAGLGGAGGGGGGSGSGGSPGGGAGTSSGSGGAAGGGGTATPVAIGTVKSVSGTTITITNFAGKVITVTVPPTATVTTNGPGGLVAGATVSVAGTTSADGSVTATSVTSHATGG